MTAVVLGAAILASWAMIWAGGYVHGRYRAGQYLRAIREPKVALIIDREAAWRRV